MATIVRRRAAAAARFQCYSRPRDRTHSERHRGRTDGWLLSRWAGYSYTTFIYDPYYSLYYNPYYRSRDYWNPLGYGFGLRVHGLRPVLLRRVRVSRLLRRRVRCDFGGGSGYGGGGYGSRVSQVSHGVGSLRLKVKPGHAQVFVDGYLVGPVDSFDGVFQRLNIEAGSHRIELRADGYSRPSSR